MNNNNRESTNGKASSGDAEANDTRPLFTAGTWNRRKIRGGTFLKNADLFRLIEHGEALPRIERLHAPDFYANTHEGQPEPAEALPADIPRATLRTPKPIRTGKAATSRIYLPAEWTGRDVLVIAINPETAYLISAAEARRNAQEILNEYPGDELTTIDLITSEYIDGQISNESGADINAALPDDLKQGSTDESKFTASYTYSDGSVVRATPEKIEKVKQDPEKYRKEIEDIIKQRAKKVRK